MNYFSSVRGVASKDMKNSGITKKRINFFVICTKSHSCARRLNIEVCSKEVGWASVQILSQRWMSTLDWYIKRIKYMTKLWSSLLWQKWTGRWSIAVTYGWSLSLKETKLKPTLKISVNVWIYW